MTKKLIAAILSVMIAVCGCGTAQNNAGSASGQNSGAATESAAPEDSEAAIESAAPEGSDAAKESAETEAAANAPAEPGAAEAAEPAAEQSVPDLEAGIAGISKNGNIVLTISPDSMTSLGYEPADIILIKIGNAEMEMPIGTNYTEVDSGEPICCFRQISPETKVVVLAINAGELPTVMGIAQKQTIDEEPGYEWRFAEGLDASVPVYISMVEKQGFAEEYKMHQLGKTRTNKRSDYAHLSDAEYANFRAVNTTGMGKDTLFRSSSPINPALARNEEADDALLSSMVKTVMNMADSESEMKAYADYVLTSYSDCNIIALNMTLSFFSEDFKQQLAKGFRFLASNEGPYLIHCNEGKDRTGFAAAILECLMGASPDEIVEDYMLTFYNFYGIEPGTQQYKNIANSNIESYLQTVFGISPIREGGVDLQACAEKYLLKIGMSAEEISALKENLAKDYGGIEDVESGRNTASAEKAANRIAHRYASVSEGQELMLGNREYFDGFSRNDLEFKMQKKGATIEEYKAHAAEQVLDFTGEERKAVDAVFVEMEKSLEDNGYTLPQLGEIVLIKTTMQEEPGASAYTHGTQIYLSTRLLDVLLADPANKDVITYMEQVLWHETFHCLTRYNPDLRAEMYKLIHFTVQEEDFPLPPSAFEYHISNPDVEHHNAYATFRIDGKDIDCFTDLITTQHFEQEGDLFFAYEATALIPIDGSDMYYTLDQAENFKEVFGANTSYVIDPEECMADNFSYALTYGIDGPAGGGYPNPEIIEGIMALLK